MAVSGSKCIERWPMAYIPPMRQMLLDDSNWPITKEASNHFSASDPGVPGRLGSNVLSSSPWTTNRHSVHQHQQTKTKYSLWFRNLPAADGKGSLA
ncbi:hypothetical protein QBC45DRAFT_419549 [Copromyces sp. CBS 386.78]|nr:hypothetical protein QBC45DRAFT_419549 [Copromyces sp. CBS 386.78]